MRSHIKDAINVKGNGLDDSNNVASCVTHFKTGMKSCFNEDMISTLKVHIVSVNTLTIGLLR